MDKTGWEINGMKKMVKIGYGDEKIDMGRGNGYGTGKMKKMTQLTSKSTLDRSRTRAQNFGGKTCPGPCLRDPLCLGDFGSDLAYKNYAYLVT